MDTQAANGNAKHGLRPEQLADPYTSQFTAEQWAAADRLMLDAFAALPDEVLDALFSAGANDGSDQDDRSALRTPQKRTRRTGQGYRGGARKTAHCRALEGHLLAGVRRSSPAPTTTHARASCDIGGGKFPPPTEPTTTHARASCDPGRPRPHRRGRPGVWRRVGRPTSPRDDGRGQTVGGTTATRLRASCGQRGPSTPGNALDG